MGSTARIATVLFWLRNWSRELVAQSAFPGSRRAGDTQHQRSAGVREQFLQQRFGFGTAVFDPGRGAGQGSMSPARIFRLFSLRQADWQSAAGWQPAPRFSSIGLQQLPRDHQPLDFAGAFADGAQLGVAKEFLHRIVLDEAVAAVDLHGFIGDAHGGLGGE